MTINHKALVTGKTETFFSYAGWPTVCADENDTLYAICSGNRMGHVCPFGKSLMFKSRDGGRNWSVPMIVDDSAFDDRDTGILYLGGGKLLMTNFRHPVEAYETDLRQWVGQSSGSVGLEMLELCKTLDEKERKGGSFYKISRDYGETWGEKIQIPVSCPHGPVLLNNGDLLYVGKEMYSGGEEETGTINAYGSKPDPIVFRKIGRCNKPEEYGWDQFHEPHCVQLDDGRILALFRAHTDPYGNRFTMFRSFSEDHGRTWTKAEATGICGSPPHLLKLRDGRVILSYARRDEPFGIRARVLDKDGTIPPEELILDAAEDSDIGYPATAELKNGELVTVFYKREISGRHTSIVSVNWNL